MADLIECTVVKKNWHGFEEIDGKRVRKTFKPGERIMASPNQLAKSPNLMTSAHHKALADAEAERGKQYQRDLNERQGETEEVENALEQQDADPDATDVVDAGDDGDNEDEDE